jgi:hypothetical protein
LKIENAVNGNGELSVNSPFLIQLKIENAVKMNGELSVNSPFLIIRD